MALEISYSQGDLLESNATIICHQTNCLGVMGGGIALQIKRKYPLVFKAYQNYCNLNSPLGQCQLVSVFDGKMAFPDCGNILKGQYVANLFGQYYCGSDKRYTDYNALTNALHHLCFITEGNKDISIAVPYKMGCGLAGGNWNVVFNIIKNTLEYHCIRENRSISLKIIKFEN